MPNFTKQQCEQKIKIAKDTIRTHHGYVYLWQEEVDCWQSRLAECEANQNFQDETRAKTIDRGRR